MSMKVYLGMKLDGVKSYLDNRGNEPKPRIDTDLPLNLRMGSRVQLSEAPFLLAGEESNVKYPGEESLVGAYSESELASLKTFRIYLKDRNDSEQESMLLILMDGNTKEVAEIYFFREQAEIPMFYTSRDEVPPEGDEVNAINFWIGEAAGIIGMPLFHTPDELTYERLWDSENDAEIPAHELQEVIHLDPYGEKVMKVEHLGTMLYVRTTEGLGGDYNEYLMPTVEQAEETICVRVWAGMKLEVSDLNMPDSV